MQYRKRFFLEVLIRAYTVELFSLKHELNDLKFAILDFLIGNKVIKVFIQLKKLHSSYCGTSLIGQSNLRIQLKN